MNTPYYIFRSEDFKKRIMTIREVLKNVDLTFSIKANPFLLDILPDEGLIKYVEVCSPGELQICKHKGIKGDRILYSGVMKEAEDIHDAVFYGASFVTAESKRHFELISGEAERSGKNIKVLLRLTSGNQFGMSEEDILDILSERSRSAAEVIGIHYYSGTAKNRLKQIEKDIEHLSSFLERAEKEQGFVPALTEYGPGLSAEYYQGPVEEKDRELLNETGEIINSFAGRYKLGIEMGRFMAADSGSYYTRVKDIKENHGVNYVIVDGGVHQLKYYGQNMAMKVPPLSVIRDEKEVEDAGEKVHYCICGSLCTVADVLVRDVELPKLDIGDVLCFKKAGAYSVSEGAFAFLSRNMPEIWVDDGSLRCLREEKESWILNCGGF